MKLALITDKKAGTGLLEAIRKELSEQVLGLETSTVTVPFPEDIPFEAKKQAEKADAVLAYCITDTRLKAEIISKLIDIELEKNKKIIKAIKSTKEAEESEEEEGKEKETAKQLAETIIEALFKNN